MKARIVSNQKPHGFHFRSPTNKGDYRRRLIETQPLLCWGVTRPVVDVRIGRVAPLGKVGIDVPIEIVAFSFLDGRSVL